MKGMKTGAKTIQAITTVTKKARLIKKDSMDAAAVQAVSRRKGAGRKVSRESVRQKVDKVIDWVERKGAERQDPRKAFAALFTRTQTS